MKKYRNLILSPHIDDEVLGCYTYLGPDSFVMYFGVENRENVSSEERLKELKKSVEKKKFGWQIENFPVNDYQGNQLITPLENCINIIRPDTILVPHPSYNQDHRAVYEAAMVALRPHDRNFFVRRVLVYEQPHTYLWPMNSFEPNFFVELDIEGKIALYELYNSQVRSHRSASLLRALAELRGNQSGKAYAEAYFCKRFIFDRYDG
jgi:LmbE family N-acetylglucosaminyl deacetylase